MSTGSSKSRSTKWDKRTWGKQTTGLLWIHWSNFAGGRYKIIQLCFQHQLEGLKNQTTNNYNQRLNHPLEKRLLKGFCLYILAQIWRRWEASYSNELRCVALASIPIPPFACWAQSFFVSLQTYPTFGEVQLLYLKNRVQVDLNRHQQSVAFWVHARLGSLLSWLSLLDGKQYCSW